MVTRVRSELQQRLDSMRMDSSFHKNLQPPKMVNFFLGARLARLPDHVGFGGYEVQGVPKTLNPKP